MKSGIKTDGYLKAGYAKEKKQQELKKRFNIEQEQIKVKVVSGAAQIFNLIWKILKSALKTMCWIGIAWLAIIGVAALLYPNIRAELIETVSVLWLEIEQLLQG